MSVITTLILLIEIICMLGLALGAFAVVGMIARELYEKATIKRKSANTLVRQKKVNR